METSVNNTQVPFLLKNYPYIVFDLFSYHQNLKAILYHYRSLFCACLRRFLGLDKLCSWQINVMRFWVNGHCTGPFLSRNCIQYLIFAWRSFMSYERNIKGQVSTLDRMDCFDMF